MAETYYRKIKGKNYDRRLLELADVSTSGKGDGRISLKDARAIFKAVKDSDSYTDIEKRTVQYIRDSYKFTDEADKWFRTEIRSWAATRKKAPSKKPAAKKTAQKKATPKKPVSKKTAAKKTTPKKAAAKKPTVKKTAAMKAPAKRALPDPFTEKPVMTEPEEQAALMAPVETPAKTAKLNRMNSLWLLLILVLIVGVVYLITYDGGMNLDPDRFRDTKSAQVEKEAPLEKKDIKTVEKAIPGPVSEKKALTPEGKAVESIVIYFDRGMGWISYDQKQKIIPVIEYLKKNTSRVRITGHSSSEGGSSLNSALALYRARMVGKYIVSRGIDEQRITVSGSGDTAPAIENPKAGEVRKNRRVEFSIY